MNILHSLYQWNAVIGGGLLLIGLALAAGFRIDKPAMILAIFMVVIFSILVLFTNFLNTMGVVL